MGRKKAGKFEQQKTQLRKSDDRSTRRRRRRRRPASLRALLVLTVLLVTAVGAVLSLTVFFKIRSIDVYGESIYSTEEIVSAGNIALESNLIRLDGKKVAARIEQKLPYLERVRVSKKLPTGVVLEVTAARTAGYVQTEQGYSILSCGGKVLEICEELPENVPTLTGVSADKTAVAGKISDPKNLKSVQAVYDALGRGMSKNVTAMDVSDSLNLSFVYRDRVTVQLGSQSDLSEKLKFAVKILSDPGKVGEDDVGIIYASNAKRISFLCTGSYSELQEKRRQQEQGADGESSAPTEDETPASDRKPDSENSKTRSGTATSSAVLSGASFGRAGSAFGSSNKAEGSSAAESRRTSSASTVR